MKCSWVAMLLLSMVSAAVAETLSAQSNAPATASAQRSSRAQGPSRPAEAEIPSTAVFHPLLFERDTAVEVRDGTELRANVFRPASPGRFPVIVTLGPYPKDIHFRDWNPEGWNSVPEKGPYMHWETVNPEWWVPQGYAVVRVDTRGTGKSPGEPSLLTMAEARDFYDVVEWAGERPWSNGKVGVMGISYFAMAAWRVASLDPPHLAAVVPWEGALDIYRHASRHGGILSNTFVDRWSRNVDDYTAEGSAPIRPASAQELLAREVIVDHPDVAAIRAPLLSAANWGGQGLHLGGNIYGFLGAGSEHKMLRIHVGNHYGPFYSMEGRLLQKRFLDHWLKGIDTGIDREPPIKLAIRYGGDRYRWRYENELPLARTRWTPYYLDARTDALSTRKPGRGTASYSAAPGSDGNRLTFTTAPAEREIEITGPVKLKLWLSSTADDADLFVILKNFDENDTEVTYPGTNQPELAAAYGWLRVSHRELDPQRTTRWRPVHRHAVLQKLEPGEVVSVEVEVLPTSIVLERGHRLVLEVAAEDDPRIFPFTHTDPADRQTAGTHTVYTGGQFDSHLLLPIIPPASSGP